MIIIGHEEVEFNPFYFIKAQDDIEITPANATVIFEYTKDRVELCRYCVKNSISFALICDEPKDILLGSANGASFIVCDKVNITSAQKYADEYMFDAKILLYTTKVDELLWCAENGIDGILLEEGIEYSL